jgi:AraC-like DNA-binding protein
MKSALDTYFRYFPVSPTDEDWGIYVTTAGYVNVPPGGSYPPPGHPEGYEFFYQKGRVLHEFQLHYITRGGGDFESASAGPARIEPGMVFMLFPGEWHRYTSWAATGWYEYWVGFGGQYATHLLQRGFVSRAHPVLRPGNEHALLDLFTGMISGMRREGAGSSHILGATASLMLATVYAGARSKDGGNTHAETVIRKVKALFHERLDAPLKMEQVAEDLHVGYAWLRRIFHDHTGLALHQYHLQLRLNRAMNLLGGSLITVKEVAHQTGFDDAHYFSRLFKKKTGSSPEAWRNLSQGKAPDFAVV